MTFYNVLFSVVGFVVSLIFVAPLYAGVLHEWSLRRLGRTACPVCDMVVGRESIEAAGIEARRRAAEAVSGETGLRRRIILRWEFDCPHCHGKLRINDRFSGIVIIEANDRRE